MTTIKLTRVLAGVLALPLFAGCSSDDGADAGPVSYTLRVIVPGGGSVTSSDSRIVNCTTTCTATFPEGTVVLLTATAAQGATFDRWAGGACNGTANPCTVVMTKDQEEVAIFNTTVAGGIGNAFGLTTANQLFSFNVDLSGAIPVLSNALVSGLDTNDELVGIDFRPANGLLYGLAKNGTTGKLYLINKSTTPPTAVKVSTLNAALSGTDFAVDFDPYNDWLRVISNSGQTLRVTLDDSSTTIVDSSNGNPGLTGAAYNNNFAGTADSTLYVINTNFSPAQLLKLTPPTSRVKVKDLNVTISAANGFDIEARTDTAYIIYKTPSSTETWFGAVDFSTGAVTAQALGIGGADVRGLAIPTPGVPEVFGVRAVLDQAGTGTVTEYRLVKFGPLTPESATAVGNKITVPDTEAIVGIDFRSSNDLLYALTREEANGTGRLYTLNTSTGAASLVGTLTESLTAATVFGMDFDPTTDTLRIVSTAKQNLRWSPATGITSKVADLARVLSRPTGVAFNNSQSPSSGATTMYVIDTQEGRLGTVETAAPNEGRFSTIGKLGVAVNDLNGFEIIGRTDTNPDPNIQAPDQVALLALGSDVADLSILYQVNLGSGAATLLDAINVAEKVVGIAAQPEPNPSAHLNQDVFAITESGLLISFSRSNPGGFLTRNCGILGLNTGEKILSLDFRPTPGSQTVPPGLLYALGDGGPAAGNRLLNIDTTSCSINATLTRPLMAGPGDPPYVDGMLEGKKVGMDFDAVSNVLRITTGSATNCPQGRPCHLVVNPDTGVVRTVQNGIWERPEAVGAAAYTATGTLYDINLDGSGSTGNGSTGTNGVLMIQDGDAGKLHDVGILFPDPQDPHAIDGMAVDGTPAPVMSFDLFGKNDSLALAVLRERVPPSNTTKEQFTRLYRVNLVTGQLKEIVDVNGDGGIGPRPPPPPSDPRETRYNVTDIAVRFPPAP